MTYCLLNDKKIRSKGLVQGPGVQKTFRLSSRTPEQLNVMPRTKKDLKRLKSLIDLKKI